MNTGGGLARLARSNDPHVVALLLALVAATSGTARGLLVPGLKLSDVLTIALVVIIFAKWGGRWRLVDGLGFAVLGYAFVHVVVTMINFTERTDLSNAALGPELLAVPQYFLLYIVAFAIGQKSGSVMIWLRPTMILACLASLIAILQVIDVGPVREVLATITANDRIANPYDWQVYRASSLFPSWHALGMYLAIHVALAAACLGRGNFERRDKHLFAWTIVLGGVGVLMTATSAPIIVAMVAVVWFAISRRTAWIVVLVGLAGGGAIALTPLGANLTERLFRQSNGTDSILPQTITFRFDIWSRDFFPIIGENLWSGYGPVDESDHLFAHMESMYILLLMRGGLALIVAFVILLIVAFFRMNVIARPRMNRTLQAPARAARYLVVAVAVAMSIHPYLNDAGGAAMIFTMLGVFSGLHVRESVVSRSKTRLHSTGRAEATASIDSYSPT